MNSIRGLVSSIKQPFRDGCGELEPNQRGHLAGPVIKTFADDFIILLVPDERHRSGVTPAPARRRRGDEIQSELTTQRTAAV